MIFDQSSQLGQYIQDPKNVWIPGYAGCRYKEGISPTQEPTVPSHSLSLLRRPSANHNCVEKLLSELACVLCTFLYSLLRLFPESFILCARFVMASYLGVRLGKKAADLTKFIADRAKEADVPYLITGASALLIRGVIKRQTKVT